MDPRYNNNVQANNFPLDELEDLCLTLVAMQENILLSLDNSQFAKRVSRISICDITMIIMIVIEIDMFMTDIVYRISLIMDRPM